MRFKKPSIPLHTKEEHGWRLLLSVMLTGAMIVAHWWPVEAAIIAAIGQLLWIWET